VRSRYRCCGKVDPYFKAVEITPILLHLKTHSGVDIQKEAYSSLATIKRGGTCEQVIVSYKNLVADYEKTCATNDALRAPSQVTELFKREHGRR
jgi:hypothetical protein